MSWQEITNKVGSAEQLEAMGAVASLYNDLEYTFFGLLTGLSNGEFESSRAQFLSMRNPARLALFRKQLQQTTEPGYSVERLSHFADCFEICAQNRNLLMHSWTWNLADGADSLLVLKSTRKPTGFEHLNFTSAELRAVATEIWRVNQFGQTLSYLIGQTGESRDAREDKSVQFMTPEQMCSLPRLIATLG